jgi:lipopolysaccharide/colanic/teichoic acid biosynthesis glycosyltransferase
MSANTTYFQKNLTFPTQFAVSPILSVLLLLADLAGVYICAGFALWMQFKAPLVQLIQQVNPLAYGIVLSGFIGLYLFDVYNWQLQVAVVWTRFRFIISFLSVSFLGAALIYFSNVWANTWLPYHNILLVSLSIFPLWAIVARFLAVTCIKNSRLSCGIAALNVAPNSIEQLSDAYEKIRYRVPLNLLNDNWFNFAKGFKLNSGQFHSYCKRVVDVIAAGILLVLLFPLMALAGIAVKLNSPGSMFYSQVRSGYNGQTFRVYKFRSMYQNAEQLGAQWAMEQDPRITPVGKLLRLTRIDELPQLVNVLKGEMSLIGPRPERPEFDIKLAEVIPYYKMRYSIKPGITGWAQVMYPYGASVDDAREKLSYDLYYIKYYSLALDFAIALKTIRVVLLGKGR